MEERTAVADRLSELPDCILENILSRVTTRQACRTSVLSRRWRHVWRAVPSRCIDIDQSEFQASPPSALKKLKRRRSKEENREVERFMDSADHVTTLHASSSPLDAFRLRVNTECALIGAAQRWISRGITRRPVSFTLHCDRRYLCHNDPLQFSFSRYSRSSGTSAVLSRLRTLHLYQVVVKEDMGCFITDELPVLEDLQLVWCYHRFDRLASASLKNLVVDNGNVGFSEGATMVLAVPRVASLRISNSMRPVTSEGEMPLVVAASLTHRACVLGLLESVRGAISLDLLEVSARALPFLQGVKDPVLPNLRTLHLYYDCDVGVLRHFLQNAQKLERLTVRFAPGSSRTKNNRMSKSKQKTSSDHQHGTKAYECKNVKSVGLEFDEDRDVSELNDALDDISRERVLPIESSTTLRNRKVKFLYK
ncbi:hypothetical protein QOZ80_4BG0347960 [Eleusine coracana subsp. coracana]|nr:hypothetical protein QOZ80_4BG0347960 [Eleusine coracana subsp. coracana]